MNYSSIALPVGFTFYRLPIEWRVSSRKGPVPNGEPDYWFEGTILDKQISSLDPHKARLSFLRLQAYRQGELEFLEPDFLEPLLNFLNSVGSFMEEPFRAGRTKTFDLPKRGNAIPVAVVPKLRLQSRSISYRLDMLQRLLRSSESFPHFFDVGLLYTRKGPEPHVTTSSFWPAAMAITLVDLVRRAKIRACAECGAPFPLYTKHAKKYCEWSCAHRAAVRASRLKKLEDK